MNTAGRGCVLPLALPSAAAIETVGREAIASVDGEGLSGRSRVVVEVVKEREEKKKTSSSDLVEISQHGQHSKTESGLTAESNFAA